MTIIRQMRNVDRKALEFEALVRELEGLRQSHRWHLMDTAPHDGTKILAYCPKNNHGEPIIAVTWWRQDKDHKSYIGWGEFNIEMWPPTHWMPLPKEPEK